MTKKTIMKKKILKPILGLSLVVTFFVSNLATSQQIYVPTFDHTPGPNDFDLTETPWLDTKDGALRIQALGWWVLVTPNFALAGSD
jgi:hypothetical protein